MTTETPRVALYQRLNEVLGPDHASTLMTYLPTDEPATKSDVRALKSDISELRSEVKSDISELRSELKSDISELRSELKSDMRELEHRLGQGLDKIETRLNGYDLRFDNVHEAMRQQTRTFILATSTTMVTLSAVAFGAASLI